MFGGGEGRGANPGGGVGRGGGDDAGIKPGTWAAWHHCGQVMCRTSVAGCTVPAAIAARSCSDESGPTACCPAT